MTYNPQEVIELDVLVRKDTTEWFVSRVRCTRDELLDFQTKSGYNRQPGARAIQQVKTGFNTRQANALDFTNMRTIPHRPGENVKYSPVNWKRCDK